MTTEQQRIAGDKMTQQEFDVMCDGMTTEHQRIADLESLVGRLLKRIEALEAWRAGSIPLMQADKPPARSSGRILVDADGMH